LRSAGAVEQRLDPPAGAVKKYFWEALACDSVICNYITRSPKHRDGHPYRQEKTMTTQLSTKLTALALALMVNSMMIGGVAYLFSGQIHQQTLTTLAKSSPTNLARDI